MRNSFRGLVEVDFAVGFPSSSMGYLATLSAAFDPLSTGQTLASVGEIKRYGPMDSSTCPAHPHAALEVVVADAGDQFWGHSGRFSYSVCPVCQTWILDQPPAPAELGHYYAHYYSDEELEARRRHYDRDGQPILGVDGVRAAVVIRDLKRLGDRLTEQSTVLDVGCGAGAFLRGMTMLAGVKVHGVDFDRRCTEFVKEVHGIETDVGELSEQNYADETFDLVTAWHCLEHTYDPEAELREMARITRNGGWIVLEVPTPGPIAQLFGRRWFFLQPPTHFFHFTRAGLEPLVQRARLKLIEVSYPWLPTEFAGSVLFSLGLAPFAPRMLFGRKTWRTWLWSVLFTCLLPVDLLVTGLQKMTGKSGVMRLLLRKVEE